MSISGISSVGGAGASDYQQAIDALVLQLATGVVQRAGKNPLGQLCKTMDQERKTEENERIEADNEQDPDNAVERDTTYIPNLA
jgi:hypothetical protein